MSLYVLNWAASNISTYYTLATVSVNINVRYCLCSGYWVDNFADVGCNICNWSQPFYYLLSRGWCVILVVLTNMALEMLWWNRVMALLAHNHPVLREMVEFLLKLCLAHFGFWTFSDSGIFRNFPAGLRVWWFFDVFSCMNQLLKMCNHQCVFDCKYVHAGIL